MKSLRVSRWLWMIFLLYLVGCSTQSYRVLKSEDLVTEINLSPERILLECESLHDAPEPGLYGFMMHVLDEENTVLTIAQGNTIGKSDCDRRLEKIGRILKQGKKIYLGGFGELKKPREIGKGYIFPEVGTFYGNGRSLGFEVIANEFGSCYDAYSGDQHPCPREPFVLKFLK